MKRIWSAIALTFQALSARRIGLIYSAGVGCAAVVGFCSPVWYLGFGPLSAGLIWASYDLVDVPEKEAVDGKPPTASY